MALEQAGYYLHHVRGSHHYYKHPERQRYAVVALHREVLKPKTLKSILDQIELSVEEFIDLL